MMIEVDISLLTATSAIGRISGQMEFAQLPRIGETISFLLGVDASAGFSGHVTVENIIHMPNSGSFPILSLSDIVATNEAGAVAIGNAMGEKYGLFFEPYGD